MARQKKNSEEVVSPLDYGRKVASDNAAGEVEAKAVAEEAMTAQEAVIKQAQKEARTNATKKAGKS